MSSGRQSGGINPIYATTTTVKFPNDDGHGTGFYYNHNNDTYLITNKHIVREEDEEGNIVHDPDSIRIFIRGHPDISQVSHFDVDLSGGKGNDWFEHPSSTDIDVVVVPINRRMSALYDSNPVTGSIAFSSNHFLSDPDRIQGGDSALIVGYPGAFVNTNRHLPVLRNALIASPYGTNFNGLPLFITDARMHSGTSGSPVLAAPMSLTQSPSGGLTVGGQQTALLGVHSATYRQDADDPGEEWLDLNAAWYAEVIPDILATI